MKTVKYIGDPKDSFSGPMQLTVKGKTYTKGEGTQVTDEREKHLRGHNHFETESGPWPEITTDNEVDGMLEGGETVTIDQCHEILDQRGVRYKRNDDLATLTEKVLSSGGFPEDM